MRPERDLTQPIIAYRAWGNANGRLTSYGVTSAWPTLKPCVAHCLAPRPDPLFAMYGYPGDAMPGQVPHNAPGCECRCGLYGFADEATLRQVIEAPILGRVALWGTVVVCGEGDVVSGYRAEFAYPQVLYLPKDTANLPKLLDPVENIEVRALARAYGIDAVPMPQALVEMRKRSRDELSSSTLAQAYYGLGPPTGPPPPPWKTYAVKIGTAPNSLSPSYSSAMSDFHGLLMAEIAKMTGLATPKKKSKKERKRGKHR